MPLRIFLDMSWNYNRVFEEVICVCDIQYCHRVQQDNANEIARHLECKLRDVRAAVAVDDERKHHTEGRDATKHTRISGQSVARFRVSIEWVELQRSLTFADRLLVSISRIALQFGKYYM